MEIGSKSAGSFSACKGHGRLFKRATGVALAAALVPLGAVAVPAQAVTVTGSGQTLYEGAVTDTDTNSTGAGYINALASDGTNSILAQATGHTNGQSYVNSFIFNPSTGGSGGSGGSGGVAQSFTPFAATLGSHRQADANLLYEATLVDGNHTFLFHVNRQTLRVGLNDYYPAFADSAMTGMKVTIGDGIDAEVVYHWEATLFTYSAGSFFIYDDITIPGGVFEPTYSGITADGDTDYVTASGFDVGLDLGYRVAGTTIRAEYYTSAKTNGTSDAYVGSQALFGDPFGPNDQNPSQQFQVVTTAVTTPVPEPASATLLAGAMAALGSLAFGRRRRK